jgi:hypothetical protein
MHKKNYIVPTIELIDIETEYIIATSPGVGGSNNGEIEKEEDILSNKRQPMNNSWGSQNWGKDGE